MADRPEINDRFPIRENLAPPVIASPVPECSEAVQVSGFIPYATIRVLANGSELLAEVQPPFGFAEVALKRAVKVGDILAATQTVAGQTSRPSIQPVAVTPTLADEVRATQPKVDPDLYQCGIVVPVGNLVAGVRVHVLEDGAEVGSDVSAAPWHPVVTQALTAGRTVTAFAIACEGSSHEERGPPSAGVSVKAAPAPMPSPQVDPGQQIPGNTVVLVTGLLVGAHIEIMDHGAPVGGGYATAGANWCPISITLTSASSITATQELCGNASPPSPPATPSGKLEAPIVLAPICDGSEFVIVRGTQINATVVILKNGSPIAQAGAGFGDVVVGLAFGAIHAGDVITAIQYTGPTISAASNPVAVVSGIRQPTVEILGGEPFFLPQGGEEAIDGPVFPRGRGGGPTIRVQACCRKSVKATISGPDGRDVADVALHEVYPGYYSGTWPWLSGSGWPIPDGIPVGQYVVTVRTGCEQEPARSPFYVIFDPAAVGGPGRFSFDGTAVWFGTGQNSIRGLHYYLHCSDRRVFNIAIGAVSGKTSPFDGAIAVARAEEALFAYSLDFHTQDVVDLIVNFKEAQCADDACCLTALLRSVGIPAHPVTADAALETGDANWTFDTWVEFLGEHAGSTEWRIFHPHEHPGMQPESRGTFGTTRSVATRSFNDVIVMANENWVAGQLDDAGWDVTYGRNECQAPNQKLSAAPWIGELCESGYWSDPHWHCDGTETRSLRVARGFRLYRSELELGGRVEGTLDVVNPTGGRQFGNLVVELVAHRPESKAFVERSYGAVTIPATMDPDERQTVPFAFSLPETIRAGLDLYLWARLDSRTIALHELRVRMRLAAELSVPAVFGEGEEADITGTVENMTDTALRNLDLQLRAPFALSARDVAARKLETLRPRERRELTWRVKALAPLESGSLHFIVDSANGGGLMLRKPFRVVSAKPQLERVGVLAPEMDRI